MQTNSKERKAHHNNNNKGNTTMDNNTFDREALNVALKSSSLLLWVPYTLAALYVTWCASFVILPTEFFAQYAHLFTDALSIPNYSHSHVTWNETNNLTHIPDYTPVSSSPSSSPSSSSSLSSLSSLLLLLRRQHPPKELLQLYNSLLIPLLTSPSTESIRKLYALAHNPLRESNTFSFTSSSNNDELAQWCTFDWLFWLASCLSVIAFSLVAISSTYWCAVKLSNKGGEFLMVIAWVLGVVSEQWWLTSTQHHRYYHNHINFPNNHNNNNSIYTPSNYGNNYSKYNNMLTSNYSSNNGLFQPTCSTSPHSFSLFSPPVEEFSSSIPTFANYKHHNEYPLSQFAFRTVPTPPSWLWLVVSMCTGLFSGILCKVKDIVDGKQDRNSRLSRWIHRRRAKRRFRSHLHSHTPHSIHEHKHKHVNIDNENAITRESNSRSLPLPSHNSSNNATTTSLTTETKPSKNLSSTSASLPQHHNTFTVTNTTKSALRERKNSQQQQHNNKNEEEAHPEKNTLIIAQPFAPGESFSFAPNSNINKNNFTDRSNTNNIVNTEVSAQVSEKDAVHFTEEPFSPFHPIRRVRLHRSTGLGERLYMVVPFCTGQWFYFITHHGWRGVIIENGIIVLSLAMVGYTMLSFKLLKKQVLKALLRPTITSTSETDESTTEIYNYNEHGTANNVQNNNIIMNNQNDDNANHLYRRPMIRSRSSSTVNIISNSTNTTNDNEDMNENNTMESTEANTSGNTSETEKKKGNDNNNNNIKEEHDKNEEEHDKVEVEEEKESDEHKGHSKVEIKEKYSPEKGLENATSINNHLKSSTSKENLSSLPVIISASEANRMTQHRRRHRSNHKNINVDNSKDERESNPQLFTANAKRSTAIDHDVLEDSSESNDVDSESEDFYNDDDEDESEDNAELKDVEEKLVFDIIEIIFKLFTTSFGVVVFSVIAANIFLTTLAIPFIKALFSLNALVSSVGIIVELIIYDAV